MCWCWSLLGPGGSQSLSSQQCACLDNATVLCEAGTHRRRIVHRTTMAHHNNNNGASQQQQRRIVHCTQQRRIVHCAAEPAFAASMSDSLVLSCAQVCLCCHLCVCASTCQECLCFLHLSVLPLVKCVCASICVDVHTVPVAVFICCGWYPTHVGIYPIQVDSPNSTFTRLSTRPNSPNQHIHIHTHCSKHTHTHTLTHTNAHLCTPTYDKVKDTHVHVHTHTHTRPLRLWRSRWTLAQLTIG